MTPLRSIVLSLLAGLLPACSFIVDPIECERDEHCVLEDGTALVCGAEQLCIDPIEPGGACAAASECASEAVCVALDPDEGGVCLETCDASPCTDPSEVCCELDDAQLACVPADAC